MEKFKIDGFLKAIQEVEQLNSKLNESGKNMLELAINAKKLADNLGTSSFKDFQQGQEKINNATSKGRKVQTEYEKIISQKAKAEKRLVALQSEQAKELAKLKVQQLEVNKNNKEAAKEALGLNSAYTKLSKALTKSRNEAKDVGAQMLKLELAGKGNTKEYRKLEKEFTKIQKQTIVLDNGIKKLDSSLGQHQRNVGNYRSGLIETNPILSIVDRNLRVLGTDLDTLSQNKNPFKPLTEGILNLGKAALSFLATPIGAMVAALGGLFVLINRNKDTVIQFDSGLRDVGKTTGLAGQQLRDLGDATIELSRKLGTVSTDKLLEYQTIAGQLGVTGTENILAFSEALAKLETASDIAGEEGASNIARFLTLVDGGVENVEQFSDEIVNLGNNFAATENQILSNATSIAQNVGQYNIGRNIILAYATATKAVGVESELAGSVIGRTLGVLEKAIRTGKGIDTIAKLTNQNVEELKKQFSENPEAVFKKFIDGLNEVNESGGSLNGTLEQLSINSIRDQRVLSSLATKGYGVLNSALQQVSDSAGAASAEFSSANLKLENQLKRIGIAWDNLILTLEDGQGVFSKIAGFITSVFAQALEDVTAAFADINNSFNEIGKALKELGINLDLSEKKFISLTNVIKFLSGNISSLIRFISLIAKGFEKIVTSTVRATKFIGAFGVQVKSVFRQVQAAINKFDISKPFESLKRFASLDFTGEISKKAKELEKDDALKRLKKSSDELNAFFDKKINEIKKRKSDNDIDKNDSKSDVFGIDKSISNEPLKESLKDRLRLFREANKAELDLFIARQDFENTTLEEGVIILSSINAQKLELLRRNYEAEKAQAKGNADELRKIEAQYQTEKIALEKEGTDKIKVFIESIKKARVESANNEIDIFELKNQTLIDKSKELTETLVDEEKQRLAKLNELRVNALETEFSLDAEKVEAKLATNEDLTTNEIEFLQKIRAENESYRNKIAELDNVLLQNKQEIAAKEEQIERRKLQIASQGFATLSELLGKQTAAGKAAAVAQATINTYLAASQVLSDNTIPFPLKAIAVAATILSGLQQVRNITATQVPQFATGTDNAPEGWAITQERGSEIITDKKGNIKTLGNNKGAQYTYLNKGDKVFTASQTNELLKSDILQPNMPLITAQNVQTKSEVIDYNRLGVSVAKALRRNPQKHFLIKDGQIITIETKGDSVRKQLPLSEYKPKANRLN